MAKYRLLRGAHRVEGKTLQARADGNPIVESDVDLVAVCGRQKFELVSGKTDVTDDLQKLTRKELVEQAEAEELEVTDSMTKKDIIELLAQSYESE